MAQRNNKLVGLLLMAIGASLMVASCILALMGKQTMLWAALGFAGFSDFIVGVVFLSRS
ncbi:MAG: hypothetical protein JNN15_04155 [Blastocatellia bacterium]|nr:hypothetical protein [Blastocatellia bacterium]